MTADIQDKIRQRAFELWQAEGHPEGRDYDHWLKAEAELSAGLKAGAAAKKAPAKKAAAPKEATPAKAPAPKKAPAAKKAAPKA